MRNYQEYLEREKRKYGDKFDSTELADQFKPYYESGKIIEVQFNYGETKRGRVGVTTGWRPCFLLMLTTHSIGWTLGKTDTIIKVVSHV